MRAAVASAGRVVVKVGSSSLTDDGGVLDDGAVAAVADQIVAARSAGHPCALVSSGAVAAGLPLLGMDSRPGDLPGLQVAAAVGQGQLMHRYHSSFDARGVVAGQVLLTKDILANRSQYLRAREALDRMLTTGVVPIVNENDTVVVDELRWGDNDRLAAIVSHLLGAAMLILLTDTPGLLSADPRLSEDAELLSAVQHNDDILDQVTRGGAGPLGSGGVATKVAAARMAAWSGIPTVIVDSRRPDVVMRALRGEEVGTWVAPHPSRLSARKLWIAFGLPASGRIVVDEGAALAITRGGKSLLAAGIVEVDGAFAAGDAVEIYGKGDQLVGKGIAGLGADQLSGVIGRHSTEAGGSVVHRDDLVVLAT